MGVKWHTQKSRTAQWHFRLKAKWVEISARCLTGPADRRRRAAIGRAPIRQRLIRISWPSADSMGRNQLNCAVRLIYQIVIKVSSRRGTKGWIWRVAHVRRKTFRSHPPESGPWSRRWGSGTSCFVSLTVLFQGQCFSFSAKISSGACGRWANSWHSTHIWGEGDNRPLCEGPHTRTHTHTYTHTRLCLYRWA